MEKELKMIVADIDGTLVCDGKGMQPLTKAAITHLHDKGVKFGLASGRPCDELQNTFRGYGMSFDCDLVIGLNGGELIDGETGKLNQLYMLEPQSIEKAIRLLEPYEFCTASMYRENYLLAQRYTSMLEISKIHAHKEGYVADTIEDLWSLPCGKIMFRVDNPEQEAFIESVMEKNPIYSSDGYKIDYFKTQAFLMEFQDSRANKGSAILEYVNTQPDLTMENVATFGDNSNDNKMLQMAGLGVCLCNGAKDTKESADVITRYDNNHDGMGWFLVEHYPELFEDFDMSYYHSDEYKKQLEQDLEDTIRFRKEMEEAEKAGRSQAGTVKYLSSRKQERAQA